MVAPKACRRRPSYSDIEKATLLSPELLSPELLRPDLGVLARLELLAPLEPLARPGLPGLLAGPADPEGQAFLERQPVLVDPAGQYWRDPP